MCWQETSGSSKPEDQDPWILRSINLIWWTAANHFPDVGKMDQE